MNVGIIANPHKPGSVPTMMALRAALSKRGIGSLLESQTAALTGEPMGLAPSQLAQEADLVAAIGGDGTMLHAMGLLGDFAKPVAGINIGTLGFLTTCKDDELELFAAALAEGRYSTSPRTLLDAVVHRNGQPDATFTALNEVTIARGNTGRLVSLRAWVNGELLNDYRADGLILATPTGSTAYSLSAGGPLIDPHAAVILITPICPHSLSQRALVLADTSLVEVLAESPEPMLFSVDGRDSVQISPGDRIEIKKSCRSFQLLKLDDQSFYEALRQKLGWQGL